MSSYHDPDWLTSPDAIQDRCDDSRRLSKRIQKHLLKAAKAHAPHGMRLGYWWVWRTRGGALAGLQLVMGKMVHLGFIDMEPTFRDDEEPKPAGGYKLSKTIGPVETEFILDAVLVRLKLHAEHHFDHSPEAPRRKRGCPKRKRLNGQSDA